MIELHKNDFLSINGKYVGVLKSRKLDHLNSPSAREDRTTVFFEFKPGCREWGKRHEIDAPAMVCTGDRASLSSGVNPDVIAQIKIIIS